MPKTPRSTPQTPRKTIAIVGAGLAGLTAARTLAQSGHQVTVFEKSRGLGGRMSSRRSDFGRFDHGAQYFTARDPRFLRALEWVQTTAPGTVQQWQTRVEPKNQTKETRWVGVPGMNALAAQIGASLLEAKNIHLETRVTKITRTSTTGAGWSINALGPNDQAVSVGSFDAVLLALPSEQTLQLLQESKLQSSWLPAIDAVEVAPCWTLMLAFPEVLIDKKTNKPLAHHGMQLIANTVALFGSPESRVNRAVTVSNAGPFKQHLLGVKSISKTTPSASRLSYSKPLQTLPEFAPNPVTQKYTAGVTRSRKSRYSWLARPKVKRFYTTAKKVWVSVEIGAVGTV